MIITPRIHHLVHSVCRNLGFNLGLHVLRYFFEFIFANGNTTRTSSRDTNFPPPGRKSQHATRAPIEETRLISRGTTERIYRIIIQPVPSALIYPRGTGPHRPDKLATDGLSCSEVFASRRPEIKMESCFTLRTTKLLVFPVSTKSALIFEHSSRRILRRNI